MKNLKSIIQLRSVLLLAISINILTFLSCNKQEKLTSSTATSKELMTASATIPSASIGYIDAQNNFVHISEEQLLHFFKKINFASQDAHLVKYGVIEGINPADGSDAYAILAYAKEGDYHYRMTFKLEYKGNNNYAIASTGCSCKSTKCSVWGCNVSDFGPCACTDCNGGDDSQCEKTSTRLTPAGVISVFAY